MTDNDRIKFGATVRADAPYSGSGPSSRRRQEGVVECVDEDDVVFRSIVGLYIANRRNVHVLADAPEAQPADPDPTDPQPVPDAYRCGDLTDDEWEVRDWCGEWCAPSIYLPSAIRLARRKQAPPLTPREGDTVKTPYSHLSEVVYVDGGQAVTKKDEASALVVWDIWNLTVTDRPPRRPVRVWLTDEQVQTWRLP